MEPQLSVLLYSKYSSLSKTLMDMIQNSGVDFVGQFTMQSLCIDNEQIRKRILQNKQIQVTSVPCLLIIFPDGGIEKYDGTHVFEWVEGVIKQFAPPPPIQESTPRQSEEEKWRIQQAIEQQKMQEQKIKKEEERARIREENKRQYEKQYKEDYEEPEQKPVQPRRRRVIKPGESQQPSHRQPVQPVQREQEPVKGMTSIDDLPSDEEDDHASDRYRSRRPVGRIRSDEGNYEEDTELFQGNPANMRKAMKSAVKGNTHTGNDATSQKSADIMAKAKELAKGREEAPPPPGHPMNQIN